MRSSKPIRKLSLGGNVALNIARTLLGLLFPLITFPYVSRTLGVETLGKYSVGTSVIAYFLLIAGLGVSSYAIREGSQYRDDPVRLETFANQVFSVNLMATVISYILLGIFLLCSEIFHPYRDLILLLGIQIIFVTLGAEWVCIIHEDFCYLTIRTLAFQFFYTAAIFVFVKTPDDLTLYAIISVATASIPNLINYYYIRKHYVRLRFTLHCHFREHIRPILILFLSAVTISLYVNSDITILGILKSDYDVGLYSAAVKFYNIEKSLIAAAVTVMLPSFSSMVKKNDPDTSTRFSHILAAAVGITLPCILGVFMLSPDLIILFAGIAYQDASSMLRILSVAALFSFFAYFYTYAIMIPANMEKYALYASATSAISNIVLNLLLIPPFGTIVAAYTTALSELIQAGIAIFATRNIISLSINRRDMLALPIGCVSIVCICCLARNIASGQLAFLALAILGSVASYCLVLYLLKATLAAEIVSYLKNAGIAKKGRTGPEKDGGLE